MCRARSGRTAAGPDLAACGGGSGTGRDDRIGTGHRDAGHVLFGVRRILAVVATRLRELVARWCDGSAVGVGGGRGYGPAAHEPAPWSISKRHATVAKRSVSPRGVPHRSSKSTRYPPPNLIEGG